MKRILLFVLIAFSVTCSYTQSIKFDMLQCKMMPGTSFLFIDGDQNYTYYYEFTPPNYNPAGKNNILRHDRVTKVKEKVFLRGTVAFPEKKVYKVLPGKFRNNIIYMLYYARTDDKKYGLLLGEFDKDMKYLKSTPLVKVNTEEELDMVSAVFSSSKKYLCVRSGSSIIMYDNNLSQLNIVNTGLNVIGKIEVTEKGEAVILGMKASQTFLARISSRGDYNATAIQYDANTLCSIHLKADETKNLIYVCKVLGKTPAPAQNILLNYENDVQATSFNFTAYDFSSLEEKDKVNGNFDPAIIKKVGVRGEFIDWLAVNSIYSDGNNIFILMQKNMKKTLTINKISGDYLVAQELLLIKIDPAKTVKQQVIERHSLTQDGAYNFVLNPVMMTVNNKNYLFFYNIKTGVGTYVFELQYGVLDENLSFLKNSFMMDPKHVCLQMQNLIKMSDTRYWGFGHYENGMVIGTATIEFE